MHPKKGTPEYNLWRERQSAAHKGKLRSEEAKRKMSIAQIGERNHNYGKHLSVETRAKMSMAHMGELNHNYGKHLSIETRAKISAAKTGEHHPFYGKHHSAETRAKISIANSIAKKGQLLSEETRQKISAANKGKKRSEETKQKIAVAKRGQSRPDLIGSNNHFWRGGITFDPYPIDWTAHFRRAIRKRDNYTCVLCRKAQNKRRYAVHHINYDKEDLRSENLITLCGVCHGKTSGDREYWMNLFEMIYVPDFPEMLAVS